MEDLQKWANDPRFDERMSRNLYIYPLKIKPAQATFQGLRLAEGNPDSENYRIDHFVCASSPQSHIGPFKWAIDFLVPDGTPVIAAQKGEVVEVCESSDSWGNGPEFRDLLNYITILHEDGEFTQYCHLAKGSATESHIKIGSKVRQGHQIAVVGKTGWTDRDHLHFCTFRQITPSIGPFGFVSLKPQFKRRSVWPW